MERLNSELERRDEKHEEWKGSAAELERQLEGDTLARGVLRCMSEGIVKRREIAAALGVSVGAVTAARKRLERRAPQIRWQRNGRKKVRSRTEHSNPFC